jgi:hypothetical protein
MIELFQMIGFVRFAALALGIEILGVLLSRRSVQLAQQRSRVLLKVSEHFAGVLHRLQRFELLFRQVLEQNSFKVNH